MHREFLRDCVPPLLHKLYRRVRPMRPRFHGVYTSASAAPDEHPFASRSWLQMSAERLARLEVAGESDVFLPKHPLQPGQAPIALLLNLISQSSTCRVLDFAGGSGAIYYALHPFLASADRVIWDVVDDERLAEIGRRYCRSRHRIQFLKALPEPDSGYDVVLVNTALQYLHEPLDTVERLLAHRPRFLILTRLLAGEVPTWVTAEELHGKKVPCTILDVHELMHLLESQGWRLIFKTRAIDEPIPPARYGPDIPAELQIPYALHLVCARSGEPSPG